MQLEGLSFRDYNQPIFRIRMNLFITTLSFLVIINFGFQAANAQADDDLETVLFNLKLNRFLRLMKDAGLHDMLHQRAENIYFLFTISDRRTFFVPNDAAFDRFESSLSDKSALEGKSLRDFLNYHTSNNFWVSKGWTNEQLLPSSLAGTSLRINIYDRPENDTKVYTADGARIVSFDNMASNGVVHVLADVIYPAPPLNAYDTLNVFNEETEHFFEHITASKLLQKLKYEEPITVFVPIDIAFKKLPYAFMNNFIGDMPVVAAVIYYHIINGTYHLPAFNGKTRLRTLEGSALMVEHSGAGDKHLITVNKEAKILRSYPAINGVVHIVDTVLFPPVNPKQMLYAHKDQLSIPVIRRK